MPVLLPPNPYTATARDGELRQLLAEVGDGQPDPPVVDDVDGLVPEAQRPAVSGPSRPPREPIEAGAGRAACPQPPRRRAQPSLRRGINARPRPSRRGPPVTGPLPERRWSPSSDSTRASRPSAGSARVTIRFHTLVTPMAEVDTAGSILQPP